MRETLHCSNGQDETRVTRAFGWVVTFRDFPVGSYQTVDGGAMQTEALTYFTKGRAEFYLDGERRKDRVPGVLSSEHEVVGEGGTFTLKYVEPTTRVCIPGNINKNQLPVVQQLDLKRGDRMLVPVGFRALVCLGSVKVGDRTFKEESHFSVVTAASTVEALSNRVLLLDFSRSISPRS